MSNGIADTDDLELLAGTARNKRYAEGGGCGPNSPDISNLERVAELWHGVAIMSFLKGFDYWVAEECDPFHELDRSRAVAVLAASARDADPLVADFIVETMAAASRASHPGQHGTMPEKGWGDDLLWRQNVLCGLHQRFDRFFVAAADTWNPDRNPIGEEFPGWPYPDVARPPVPEPAESGRRYPAIRVGYTLDGLGCPFVDERLSLGRDPTELSVVGMAAWALWCSGASSGECRSFVVAYMGCKSGTEVARLVSRWIDPDGNGDAGAEALRALLDPEHPWASRLGVSSSRAEEIRFVRCGTAEQASGLMALLGPAWVVDYVPSTAGRATPDIEQVRHGILHAFGRNTDPEAFRVTCKTPDEVLGGINSALRSGVSGVAINLGDRWPGDPARLAKAIAGVMHSGHVVTVSGADISLLGAVREVVGKYWKKMGFDAVGRSHPFGGRSLH